MKKITFLFSLLSVLTIFVSCEDHRNGPGDAQEQQDSAAARETSGTMRSK